MAGGVISQALKVVVLFYVARICGASKFGSFSFAYSINAFLYVLGQFGLSTFAAREVSQANRLDRMLFKSVGLARLILAVCGTIVALLVLAVVPQVTREEWYLVAGFGVSNMALAFLSDWVFQGLGKLHGWAALNIVWQGSWLVFTVISMRAGAPIWAVSFAYAGGAVIAALSGWFWLRANALQNVGPSEGRYSLREVFRKGAHLGTGVMLQTFLVWIDIIAVRLLLGQREAGLYAAGNRIALGLGMLAGFYMQGAFPLLSKAALEQKSKYHAIFQQAYNNLSFIFVPGAIWGVFYSQQIMNVVYKRQEYSEAVPVFQIFEAVLLFTTFGIVLYGLGVLLAFRQDRTYQRCCALAAVCYVMFCPIFTLRWRIIGAAAAALSVQLILFTLFEVQVRKFIIPKHSEALLGPCLAGLGVACVGLVFHVSLTMAILLLTLAYGFLGVQHLRTGTWWRSADRQIPARPE